MAKKNSGDLTPEELSALGNGQPLLKAFVGRSGDFGARTSAYNKIADAATAEYRALMSVADLDLARARATNQAEALETVKILREANASLTAQVESERRRLEQATASSAMAVHADGTSR
jgi:predicted DNA-binding transcriptional regulator YafY